LYPAKIIQHPTVIRHPSPITHHPSPSTISINHPHHPHHRHHRHRRPPCHPHHIHRHHRFNDHLVVLPPSSDKSIGETILNITVLLQSSPSSIEIITTGPQVAFSLLSLFRHIGIIPLLNTDK
jgi:hypothetical protein